MRSEHPKLLLSFLTLACLVFIAFYGAYTGSASHAEATPSSPIDWTAVLTGGLLIAAVVQCIVFWIQARRLKETVDAMREIDKGQTENVKASIEVARAAADAATQNASSYMKVERAFISYFGVNYFASDFEENGTRYNGISLNVIWMNTGRTPAKIIALMAEKKIVGSSFKIEDIIFNEPVVRTDARSASLGPGIKGSCHPLYIKNEDFLEFRAGKCHIYIRSVFEYTDIFDIDEIISEEVWIWGQYGGVIKENGIEVGHNLAFALIPTIKTINK